MESGQLWLTVSSDINRRNDKGFVWEIGPKSASTHYFVIKPNKKGEQAPALYQPNIRERMTRSQKRTKQRMKAAADHLPEVNTENELLDEFYRRSILSVLESKWERDNFIINPFWPWGAGFTR